MTVPTQDGPVDKIIETLRERAKELQCLYEVHELTNDPDRMPDEVCRGLLDVIPPGWQFPAVCWARISVEGVVYEPPRLQATDSVQRAPISVQGETVGSI